ncbi:sensor histidine kinase [Leptolyngbya sp. KIOST-1]|uniref:sensor histidine kinase n=1 Tax=Leptolyngbya sp. KIOST-1 TaxID=1229172 RepID=UPI00055DD798|nr:histidine kinase dimerization/phospho-acceptor domain-containing protein [Leptolyngbya sp. KIOST-1]
MALPPLDHFLSPVPAYGLVTSLSEVAQALGPSEDSGPGSLAAAHSHIVVVDDAHRPIGALALGRLWAAHQRAGQAADNWADPRLEDCQTWMEPLMEVSVSQRLDASALAHLGDLAQVTPPCLLVAVDAAGRYLGLLDPVKLLGWRAIAAESSALGPGEPVPLGRGALGRRAWVLELGHALKTPMTTLLGLSTLLLDSRVGSLSERQFRYINLMQQAIRKLTNLINLLLDWMRLESGQISPSRERVYLQPLTEELVPSFLMAQPALKATADWAETFMASLETAEGWVQADPLRLRQSLHYVLSYLIANGASPAGLVVEPWGPWLGLTLWSTAAIAQLDPPLGAAEAEAAAGDGSPLDPEFSPGSIASLELALARRFSQLQGGELTGHSTPAGSRITLLLPRATATPGQTVVVLLASASPATIEQIDASLRSSPYRLAVAPSCKSLADLQTRLAPPCTLIEWGSLIDAPTAAADRLALVQRLAIPAVVTLRAGAVAPFPSADDGTAPARPEPQTLAIETLAQELRPTLDRLCLTPSLSPASLRGQTLLLLRSPSAPSALPQGLQSWLQRYHCRLLQVDDLVQANLLSRVWHLQAVILDSAVPLAIADIKALASQPNLARLPIIAPVPPLDWTAVQDLKLALVACPELITHPPDLAGARLVQAIVQARPQPPDPGG